MMHVAEDHKVRRAALLHAIQSHGQIPIAPVDMGFLPVTATGTVGL